MKINSILAMLLFRVLISLNICWSLALEDIFARRLPTSRLIDFEFMGGSWRLPARNESAKVYRNSFFTFVPDRYPCDGMMISDSQRLLPSAAAFEGIDSSKMLKQGSD